MVKPALKILLVHNFYRSAMPSGENAVFLDEAAMLRRKGHEVIEFRRRSDEIVERGVLGTLKGALSTPWNPFAAERMRRILHDEQPDVMHVHNFFPLLSPAIFYAADNLETATVMTLHNYRLYCAAGIPMRDGQPCTICLNRKSVVPALRYGCYRGSRVATVPMVLMIELHRAMRTWTDQVDVFIALSDFQKRLMAQAGLPDETIHVKPQFYPDPPEAQPWGSRENKIIFIGRLSEEKGVRILIETWRAWGAGAPRLEIIGDGPLKDGLARASAELGLTRKISFAGQLPFDEAQRHLSGARALVLPSLCFEGFPMVIREAFALTVPVVASRLGPLPGIVPEGIAGVLFRPGDSGDLLRALRSLWDDQYRLAELATGARHLFEQKYTADSNYKTLIDIYETAMRRRQRKNHRYFDCDWNHRLAHA